jgi:hypothetical protein
LSTMMRDGIVRPFVLVASIKRRSSGASVGSVVNTKKVTGAVAAKRPS